MSGLKAGGELNFSLIAEAAFCGAVRVPWPVRRRGLSRSRSWEVARGRDLTPWLNHGIASSGEGFREGGCRNAVREIPAGGFTQRAWRPFLGVLGLGISLGLLQRHFGRLFGTLSCLRRLCCSFEGPFPCLLLADLQQKRTVTVELLNI